MKRKSKKWLVLALILLFALIIVATVFFLLGKNSESTKQYREQISQEAKDFTDELISKLDRIDTTSVIPPAETAGNSAAPAAERPPDNISEAEKQAGAEGLARLEEERKQQVLQTLSAAYSKALGAQKQEAFKMADAFVAQAKADWTALKKSGENSATKKGALISEYLAKSKVMEEQMDASFEALVRKMEEQLSEEGIDPAAIIEQYRAEYKKIKEENKAAMMEKALAAIKNQ